MRKIRIQALLISFALFLLIAGCQQPLVQDPDFSTDFDLDPPATSSITGVAATQNTTPTWTYDSGGNGSYLFRYRINGGEWQTVTHTPPGPFTYTPASPLVQGVYIFEVQERDDRGNWSESQSFRTVVDLTPPDAPSVGTNGANPTSNSQPTWTWSSNSGNGTFRYDSSGAGGGGLSAETTATSYTPASPLADGTYTLTVEERDDAGNWSPAGSYSITVDTNNQPPVANIVAPGTAVVGNAVTLNGSGSSDPENDPLTYSWSVTSSPAGATWSFGTPSAATTSFVANQGGSYTVALQVTANVGSDTATAAITVTYDPIVSAGLIAYYPLDGNAVDYGPNGWNGAVTGAAAATGRRGPGTALSFDGVDDMVSVTGGPFSGDNAVSFSYWFNTPAVGGIMRFISSNDNAILLGTSASNAAVGISIPSTSTAFAPITVGSWHHIVGTYDGTSIQIYRDGTLIETVNHPGSIGFATGPLRLGVWSSTYWNGSIDDLRIYDRVLSAAEITALANE